MSTRVSSMAFLVGLVGSMLGSGPLICQAQLVSSFENNLNSSLGATWEGPGIPTSQYVAMAPPHSQFITRRPGASKPF
jgi:hypothetical protein